MSNVFKRTFTRYVDAQGRRVTKETPGARRVPEKSSKWFGQYRDADGRWKRVPLSTDKTVARQMLAELEKQVERGKIGLVDPFAGHREAPIVSHVEAYRAHLRNKGVSSDHLAETMRRLQAVLEGCRVRLLGDIRLEPVEHFLASLADAGAGARTRNTYRSSIKAFVKWCIMTRRMGDDVLAALAPARGEVRRQRRAPTEEEIERLLRAAAERPLAEAQTIRRGERKGRRVARVRPEVQAELQQLGRERALMYKTMILTGLRRGELEALEVRHLVLADDPPQLRLPGSATKNGEEARLRLHPDLAEDLAEWVRSTGKSGIDRVFVVPNELIKILKRDLAFAGIPYRDEKGRTIDVHAFRHATATYLSKNRVLPRLAQGFLRHSSIELTMQRYTDLDALDDQEVMAALPALPRIMSESRAADAPE